MPNHSLTTHCYQAVLLLTCCQAASRSLTMTSQRHRLQLKSSSRDLSSALVGLRNNKCNLKRWSKFKSSWHFIKQFTSQAMLVHLSHSTCFQISFARIFYANNWSRNIIIIEFITFFIFSASQYFSFTLNPTEQHTTTSFHPIKFENFLVFPVREFLFSDFPLPVSLNVCLRRRGKSTGRNVEFLRNITFLLWYRKLLHTVSLLWSDGVRSDFGWEQKEKKITRKVKTTTCSLIVEVCVTCRHLGWNPKCKLVNRAINAWRGGETLPVYLLN